MHHLWLGCVPEDASPGKTLSKFQEGDILESRLEARFGPIVLLKFITTRMSTRATWPWSLSSGGVSCAKPACFDPAHPPILAGGPRGPIAETRSAQPTRMSTLTTWLRHCTPTIQSLTDRPAPPKDSSEHLEVRGVRHCSGDHHLPFLSPPLPPRQAVPARIWIRKVLLRGVTNIMKAGAIQRCSHAGAPDKTEATNPNE